MHSASSSDPASCWPGPGAGAMSWSLWVLSQTEPSHTPTETCSYNIYFFKFWTIFQCNHLNELIMKKDCTVQPWTGQKWSPHYCQYWITWARSACACASITTIIKFFDLITSHLNLQWLQIFIKCRKRKYSLFTQPNIAPSTSAR